MEHSSHLNQAFYFLAESYVENIVLILFHWPTRLPEAVHQTASVIVEDPRLQALLVKLYQKGNHHYCTHLKLIILDTDTICEEGQDSTFFNTVYLQGCLGRRWKLMSIVRSRRYGSLSPLYLFFGNL
ncbi:hypothetical protein ACJIZ3_019864 [Penstemon smallii]|uniref:Uncharacterized protein n=1 Tax=Penstemon smallii TaxID=265156 RepID=A0ABD3T2B9_9LAMI